MLMSDHHRQGPCARRPVPERPVALPPENQGANVIVTAIPTITAAMH
jgi:hypothetical protein